MAEVKQLHSKTLVYWLIIKKEFTILDIRPLIERVEWFIPESKNINAYVEVKAGNVHALDNFDHQKPVVTLCARDKLSIFDAELLANKSVETYALNGGMNSCNTTYDRQEIVFDNFKIIQIRRVAKGCLSYIISSKNEAIVFIFSSLNPIIHKEMADAENWQIKYLTDTLIHASYFSRTLEVAKKQMLRICSTQMKKFPIHIKP
mgnify:CR=1 FL=1